MKIGYNLGESLLRNGHKMCPKHNILAVIRCLAHKSDQHWAHYPIQWRIKQKLIIFDDELKEMLVF